MKTDPKDCDICFKKDAKQCAEFHKNFTGFDLNMTVCGCECHGEKGKKS